MARKRTIKPGLTLGHNLCLAMIESKMRTKEVCKKSGVSTPMLYWILRRPGRRLTKSVLKVGEVVGFNRQEIKAAIKQIRLMKRREKQARWRRDKVRMRAFRLLLESVSLFEKSKGKEV